MVQISEIIEEDPPPQAPVAAAAGDTDVIGNGVVNAADARAQERLSDADEIEAALSANHIARPSARLHIENLITKLRKEGAALQRVAASNKADSSEMEMEVDTAKAEPTKPSITRLLPSVPKSSPANLKPNLANKYQTFPTHYFDLGGYSSATISVYVPLEGVGRHDRAKISCIFTASSFDLVVTDYSIDGGVAKTYRLLNDNLDKDIVPDKSKCVVKPNKIIIKLSKVKGEYGFDSWTDLTAKKKKKRDNSGKPQKDDPSAGIMDMMKDMYDKGDDNMKKMIGETMMKQRTGQLDKPGMPGGMPGMDGLGDMGMGM